jgi:hypothetical protein
MFVQVTCFYILGSNLTCTLVPAYCYETLDICNLLHVVGGPWRLTVRYAQWEEKKWQKVCLASLPPKGRMHVWAKNVRRIRLSSPAGRPVTAADKDRATPAELRETAVSD